MSRDTRPEFAGRRLANNSRAEFVAFARKALEA